MFYSLLWCLIDIEHKWLNLRSNTLVLSDGQTHLTGFGLSQADDRRLQEENLHVLNSYLSSSSAQLPKPRLALKSHHTMVLGHNPLLSDEPRLMHTVLLKPGINAHVANPIMWYGVCDRERDKGQYLILQLICFYVERGAEQIGCFLRVSSAASRLCGGLRRFRGAAEIPEITCFHSHGHNGFKKKKNIFIDSEQIIQSFYWLSFRVLNLIKRRQTNRIDRSLSG